MEILQQVDDGDLPFDRTMKISTAEDQADKDTIGQRIPMNLEAVRQMLGRNRDDWDKLAREPRTARTAKSSSWPSGGAVAAA